MGRTLKLTWQPGNDGRAGRWKKKYKRASYYFPGGRGKSDRAAYQQALLAWEVRKREIDRTGTRKFQDEYDAEIDTWEQVLLWCRQHDEEELAHEAHERVERLRSIVTQPKLKRLARAQTFEVSLELPRIEIPERTGPMTNEEVDALRSLHVPTPTKETAAKYAKLIDGSPERIAKEVWSDRIASQRRKAAPADESIGKHADDYIAGKDAASMAGKLSRSRVYKVRLQLHDFANWIGRSTSVAEISGKTLMDYYGKILKKVEQNEWSLHTADDRMGIVKSFVRWLWQIEAIDSLPRVLDSKSKALAIGKSPDRIIVYTNQEIQTLLENASPRTRLYLLLVLNCGMTQKDISDLHVSELDWNAGVITRKRSKTRNRGTVPTVGYRLWPQTLQLLKKERARNSTARVLLNGNGHPLWEDDLRDDGTYTKNDNIKSAFDRLRNKTGITKPLKALRKTSATRLRANSKYASVRDLFLGHAPSSIADRHYADAPQRLLDEAIEWLGVQYGVGKVK